MNEKIEPSRETFFKKYTAAMHKWTFCKTVFVVLTAILFLLALLFLVWSQDAIAAICVTFAFVCFFVFYSLSYTIRELVLVKAMQCKESIEPCFDLAQEEQLYDCIEQYDLLAAQAKKEAFLYESDEGGFSPKMLFGRLERFFGWREFHLLEEVCLLATIDLFTRQVRKMPCDVRLHMRLASAYIKLQHHYLEPIQAKKLMLTPSLFITNKQKLDLQEKATQAARLALEELEIMREYAPDEIWVREQLAISYKELALLQKEIEELEKLLTLTGEDPQILLRLGTLYFQTGYPGKGLRMYGKLKESNPLLGDELINQYGSFSPFLQFEQELTCTS